MFMRRISASVIKKREVHDLHDVLQKRNTNRIVLDDLDMPSLDSLRHDPNYEITVKNLETGEVRVIRGDGRR